MIETEQSVDIGAGIDTVWNHVKHIEGWAALMPGYQSCDLIDDDTSRWTLKVGAGGLVRTVVVAVHVERWDGPGAAEFTYRLERDPVEGSGAYRATALADGGTEIALTVRVAGSGPMAPMWEALGKPLLPQFARAFAQQLKERIEESVGDTSAPVQARPGGIGAWLRRLWTAVMGRHKEEAKAR